MLLLSKELRRLIRLYARLIAKELPEPHTEYMAEMILILAHKGHSMTQKELTVCMQVDKSRMVMMVEELNKLNYLFVVRNPLDRREHFIQLTEKGKRLVPIIETAIKQVNKVVHQHLATSAIVRFEDTIRQIEQNLTNAVSH